MNCFNNTPRNSSVHTDLCNTLVLRKEIDGLRLVLRPLLILPYFCQSGLLLTDTQFKNLSNKKLIFLIGPKKWKKKKMQGQADRPVPLLTENVTDSSPLASGSVCSLLLALSKWLLHFQAPRPCTNPKKQAELRARCLSQHSLSSICQENSNFYRSPVSRFLNTVYLIGQNIFTQLSFAANEPLLISCSQGVSMWFSNSPKSLFKTS